MSKQHTKSEKEILAKFDERFANHLDSPDHDGKLLNDRWGAGEIKDFLIQSIRGAYQQGVEDGAKQSYLECLAVESGEGECARAIRTKFNLDTKKETKE